MGRVEERCSGHEGDDRRLHPEQANQLLVLEAPSGMIFVDVEKSALECLACEWVPSGRHWAMAFTYASAESFATKAG